MEKSSFHRRFPASSSSVIVSIDRFLEVEVYCKLLQSYHLLSSLWKVKLYSSMKIEEEVKLYVCLHAHTHTIFSISTNMKSEWCCRKKRSKFFERTFSENCPNGEQERAKKVPFLPFQLLRLTTLFYIFSGEKRSGDEMLQLLSISRKDLTETSILLMFRVGQEYWHNWVKMSFWYRASGTNEA